jgi:hypothetical protein
LKTGDRPEDTGAYAFARANLLALWYGKVAAVDGMAELQKAQEENAGPFSVLAAMMRGTKLGTNDYVCAKRAISRFGVPQSGKNIQTMAELLTTVYTTHILINEATLKILKEEFKFGMENNMPKIMDRMSTLQVQRGQAWSDVTTPTTMALLLLVDQARPNEKEKLDHIILTVAQKKALLNWINEHFSELSDGTPEDQLLPPAQNVKLYT